MPRQMRRQFQQVDDAATLERWLQEAVVGRLATIDDDGYPLITPVNFVYADGRLYFHSATEGEKLDNLRQRPRVGFEVDRVLAVTPPPERGCQTHCLYRSAIVRGTARVLTDDDGERKEWALCTLIRKYAPRMTDLALEGVAQTAVVEITIAHVTGKQDVGQRWSPERKLAVARELWQRDGEAAAEAVLALGVDPDTLRDAGS
ncbi:MAG: pyridoxamine 5'-phosphate oxidase family protein [Anaerolineae bacterium]